MSSSDIPPDEPVTEHDFDRALGRLVRAAAADGVDVRGGYRVDLPDDEVMGVEIYRVVRRGD